MVCEKNIARSIYKDIEIYTFCHHFVSNVTVDRYLGRTFLLKIWAYAVNSR